MKKLLFLFCLFAMAASARAELASRQDHRVALVVGNAEYSAGKLKNPVNDARSMAAKLKELGFEVLLGVNLNREGMYRDIGQFADRLKSARVGLFYYAGHGMQIKGRNYLVPVDASIRSEDDVEFRGIDVNFILSKLDAANSKVNMLILDACRNNPFIASDRSVNLGLAQMDAPMGTLIAFSTAPGALAEDGKGTDSIYTRNLLDRLAIPGIPVEEVFKQVRVAVAKETHDRQIPWESTSLMGDFYFVPPQAGIKPASATQENPHVASTESVPRSSHIPEVPLQVKKPTTSPSRTDDAPYAKTHRDFNREGYEIEVRAKTITSDELHDLTIKAEKGDAVAQTTLGWAYLIGKGQMDGRGIPRSNRKGLRWILAAAEQGYPVAENNLGALYMGGIAVKMDFPKAKHYFKEAADQGYTTAQINLIQVSAMMGDKFDPRQIKNVFDSVQNQMKQPVR